jgi:hypothetical protein
MVKEHNKVLIYFDRFKVRQKKINSQLCDCDNRCECNSAWRASVWRFARALVSLLYRVAIWPFLKLIARNKMVWPFGFFNAEKYYILRTVKENLNKICNILWNSYFETCYSSKKWSIHYLPFFFFWRLLETSYGQIFPFYFFGPGNPFILCVAIVAT